MNKDYRVSNKTSVKERQLAYYKANKEVFLCHNAKRRAKASQATPNWLSDTHKAHIKRTYKLAQSIREATGLDYHVDHIVPLNGSNVCGLHVPWNLQVLRADLNLSKSNKLEGE